MEKNEKQDLFISKFCSIINYKLPLHKQVVGKYYNSPISILISKYSQPVFIIETIRQEREYHTLSHAIDCCFSLDESWQDLSRIYNLSRKDYNAIFLALSYHDVIYETYKKSNKTNEQLSALFAKEQLFSAGMDTEIVDSVVGLIEATDHSMPINEDAMPLKRIIRDIDLMGLASSKARFDYNFHAIRAEYSWAPEKEFMIGRLNFLRFMISRENIFLTSYFRKKLEETARLNIKMHISYIENIINNNNNNNNI